MPRIDSWESTFTEIIEAAAKRLFLWGDHDCAMFSGKSVEALTGENPLADYCHPDGRARYSTPLGAYRILKRLDEGSLEKAVTRKLGEPIKPLFAQRGDVVLQRITGDELFTERLGVCVGSVASFAHDPYGLSDVSLKLTAMAWRV